MVDIEKLKPMIIERLLTLKPDKIILFGSFAYGKPNDDSDIDIFLIKDNLVLDELTQYEVQAKIKLLDVMKKYKTNGIDILSAPTDYINNKEDYFYKVDILQNGKVWYERSVS